MTNLEEHAMWLQDRISYYRAEHSLPYSLKLAIRELYQMVREKKGSDFEPENFVDWLSEEHKEPIKLKQWEYDTIKYHGKLSKFNDIHFLMAMKNKGHFKDMNSVEKCSMTIKEILENCEVIE